MATDSFIIGANYPWRHYGQDFGTSAWGYRGVAGAAGELRQDFEEIGERLPAAEKRVIRVFIFADGRSSPELGPSGEVTGLDDFFFRDFDALVETAQQTNLLLMPVLLDFHFCFRHSQTITEPAKRASFLETALVPILDRYGKAPEIFAWDLINEPEWVMRRLRNRLGRRPLVRLAAFRVFVQECSAVIHARTEQPVTLGSARPQWLRFWRGVGLDLYQCHWYQAPWRLRLAASRAGIQALDRPCLVGEAPTAGVRMSPAGYIEKARREGYSGILFWSYRAKDRASDFSRVFLRA